MKTKKGFTLIELMVVIAIIAILSTIIIASLGKAKAKSRDAKRVSDIANLQVTLELYFDKCNAFPATLALSANTGCPSGTNLGSFITVIPSPPANPNGETTYKYAGLNAGCTDYHLGSTLELSDPAGTLHDDLDAAQVSQGNVCGGTDFPGTDPVYDVNSRM